MKRQNINIATCDGTTQIVGYVSADYPGIAIHRNLRFNDLWCVSHIASGFGLCCEFGLRRIAADFAAQVGRLVDFTKSGEEVEQQVADRPEVRAKMRELAERFKR
jgi:hypothetical protein